MVSDTRCTRGGWEYGLVFDRITGLTGLRDDGRNAEGAEITRRTRRSYNAIFLLLAWKMDQH